MEWISVKDRLPKSCNERVLCCYCINIPDIFQGYARPKGIYTYVYFYPEENRWGKWNEGNFSYVPGEVTHWMPLPNPPQEHMEWIKIEDAIPIDRATILAICKSKKDVMYNCLARSWFMDTVYSCFMDGEKFIIQSHGPELPATHWKPLPEPPKE